MNKPFRILWVQMILAVSCSAVLIEVDSLVNLSVSPEEECDIMEETLRYMFYHNASAQQQSVKYYFISVNKQDPSKEFLDRFKINVPTVRKESDCSKSGEGVYLKETNEPGLVFKVYNLKIFTKNMCTVSGGYFEAGLSSSQCTYTLIKRDGKWSVVKRVLNFIS